MTIKIENLSKKYRRDIFKNLNLELQEKTIYGLLGRNGAGKSTLLNIINNRAFANSGEIFLDNQILTNNQKNLKHIYMMSEDNLFPGLMKINDMFKLSEKFYGEFNWKLCKKLVDSYDVNTKVHFKRLSTGYRSIVKLIIAMCVPCEYIFLDEPILGLDANHRDLFYQTLIETYEQRPRTFVISTHIIEEIENVLEKVIVLDKGQIIVDDYVENLLNKGKSITGPTEKVRLYTEGSTILASRQLGGITTAYVMDTIKNEKPNEVNISNISLQTLFVQLTNGGKN